MSLWRKPSNQPKTGLKVLVYGKPGTGKSVFGLSFPQVAVLDTENGITFYENDPEYGKNIVAVANSQSFNDLEDIIEDGMEEFAEQGIKTLVIDSMTKVKENLEETVLQVDEARARREGKDVNDTNISMRSWGRIGNVSDRLQNLKIDLASRGINIVDIAQAREIKEKVGEEYKIVGYRPDLRRQVEHDYDIVLFIDKRTVGRDQRIEHYGKVEKDRTGTYTAGEIIINPSYENWAEVFEADGEKITTNLSGDIKRTKEEYNAEEEKANQTLEQRVKTVISNLTDDEKKEFSEKLKEAKISRMDNLTAKQSEKLEEILKDFE